MASALSDAIGVVGGGTEDPDSLTAALLVVTPTTSGNATTHRRQDGENEYRYASTTVMPSAAAPSTTWRYVLSSRLDRDNRSQLPPLSASSGEVNGILVNDWNEFWNDIQPIVPSVERFTRLFQTVIAFTVVLWLLCLGLVPGILVKHHAFDNEAAAWFTLANFVGVVAIMSVLQAWAGRTRKAQLYSLRKMCRRAERIYRWRDRFNWKLECELELFRSATKRCCSSNFCLYFFQVPNTATFVNVCDDEKEDEETIMIRKHGYLRIELINFSKGWTPISLTTLDIYHTLPNRLAFLEEKSLWTQFWLEVCRDSRDCLWTYRCHQVLTWALFFSVALGNEAPGEWNFFISLSPLVIVLLMIYLDHRRPKWDQVQSEIVQRYAQHNFSSLEDSGCRLEYRMIYEFRPTWCGSARMHAVHYLYLFPVSASTSKKDANDPSLV